MNVSTDKGTTGLPNRLHRWLKDEHAVGLDIADGRITAAHFARHKGGLILNALASEPVEKGLSDKALAQCIHAFWKKTRFPTRTVCTCIYSPSLITRSFNYNNVSEKELKSVLRLEAEEALQLPQNEVSFSWQRNQPSGRANEISGALVAAPRAEIHNHVQLIKAAGLYPVNVEIACSAVINLYAFTNPEPPAPVCLVSLTDQMAGIVILANGAAWPRIVFSSDKAGWKGNLDYLADSINSALLQYQLKVKGDPVSKIMMTGGSLHPLIENLQKKISLPITSWDPLKADQIVLSKALQKEGALPATEIPNLAVALGLGLHHPKNDYNNRRQRTEDRRQRTEDRRQKTADRRQRAEDRRQGPEDRRQKTEGRGRRTEDRRQKTEDREQKTENRGQRTEDRERRTENGGQKTEDRERRTEDRGQRTEDRG